MVFYVKRRGESVDEGRGFTIIDYEDRYKQALEDIEAWAEVQNAL